MSHRAIVLTAAAAVLSVAGLPANVAAQGATVPVSPATTGNPIGPVSSLASPTPVTATPVQSRPTVHAMTGASGAPAISSRTPAQGATGVSRTTNVKVRFTKAVKGSTIRIRLRDRVTGSYVAGKLTYASANRTATFNPTPRLRAHRTYVVIVSGAKTSAGVVMAKTTWRFTTGG